eukprot:SAG31_NODE_2092_length_6464_cov_3.597172_2_plen_76_part_00
MMNKMDVYNIRCTTPPPPPPPPTTTTTTRARVYTTYGRIVYVVRPLSIDLARAHAHARHAARAAPLRARGRRIFF